MKKLNDQWIERKDGQEHMVKVVERHEGGDFNCAGCFFNGHTGKCLYGQECPICDVEHGYIKDLGILKDGLLPCPFCGEYPDLKHDQNGYWTECDRSDGHYAVSIIYQTEQEAKDAWNRRA